MTKTRTITMTRTFTVIIEGDVTEETYIRAAESIEELDTRDAGDATGVLIDKLGWDQDGEMIAVEGGFIQVSYDDSFFTWSEHF